MSELKKAIAYVRVSTEEQGSDDKFGVEVQTTAITGWAAQHGYSITKVVVEKMSGAKERPLMNDIVFGENTTNPPYSAVIVYKNDRVARDMKLYFYYEYVLNKKNVELLCVQDDFLNGVDSSVATLYKAMMQFVAEQERKNITLRTSSGRLAKARQGGHAGGGVPYGYMLNVSKEIVINPKEAEIARKMFYWYDKTESVGKTRDALLKEYPNLVGRKGNKMSYYTIRSIIENRYFYEGLYHYSNLGWVKGKHEPLLEKTYDVIENEEKRIAEEIKLEEKGEIYGE